MNNGKLCLCLVVLVLTVNLIECKGGRGGGGRGGGRGHSSHGSHHSGGGGWFSWGSSHSSSHGSSHTYPSSGGYSGHGSGGSHTYPHSPGYSGHGTGGSHSYPNSHGLSGSGRGSWSSSHYGYGPSRPTYYSAPQHVYVTQYREAQSPYSDLLTGLTLYNLGRSHHYHQHHYYNDDYYRQSNTGASYSSVHNRGNQDNTDGSTEEARCVLKIKKDGKEEVLKIPCAIISTFDDGNRTSDGVNNTIGTNCSSLVNTTLDKSVLVNETNSNSTLLGNNTEGNNAVPNPCNTTVITDPLTVTGAPIAPVDASTMECSVEIRTKKEVIHNNVDCTTLLKYAKMSVPENKVSDVLPHRETLKSMLNKPPWWMSLFIAV